MGGNGIKDYTQFLDLGDLNGMRIGVPRSVVLGEQREERRNRRVGGGPAAAVEELKSLIRRTSPRPRRFWKSQAN